MPERDAAVVTPSRPAHRSETGPGESAVHERLAALLAAHAPRDGRFELALPGTFAIRLSRAFSEPARSVLRPMLCIVAQGAKVVMLGRQVFKYDPNRMLVFSVDLPVTGQVVRATPAEPYLCFRLDLDPYRIADLTLRVFPNGVPHAPDTRGLYVADATEGIIDATSRLLALMANPSEARLLGPLVVDEILIRLLRSAVGSRVAQIGYTDSSVQRVARAVSEIRLHFAQPLKTEALARLVHMSVSSFHQHFKAVTSMSPLQFQKVMRLEEARRLMLVQPLDAQGAAREVGYVSASQFSREYARYFGSAPTRDIARMRKEATDAAPARGTRGKGRLASRALSIAVLLLTALPSWAAAQEISLARSGARPTHSAASEHFTGTAQVEPLFEAVAPSRMTGSSVAFAPGARTAWHVHPVGQVLIVMSGVGRVQQWGGPAVEIRPGDVVRIPPNVKHWHGASAESAMTHIALAEHVDGHRVTWLEKVQDTEKRD